MLEPLNGIIINNILIYINFIINRAKVTGRIVPEDVILTTLRKLPESIRILSPLVDFLATFENEEREPRLVYTCKHDDNKLVENTEDGEICQIYNGNTNISTNNHKSNFF